MKNIFKQAIVAVGLIAAAQGVLAAGDAAAGEGKAAMCAACHGADGNSPAPNFPKLAGLGEKYLLKQMHDIKAGDRQVMEMTGLLDSMSEQDMADIAAFFDSKTTQLAGAKPLTVRVNSGADVDGLALGETLYRAGKADVGTPACTGCHSPRGQGNEPAGYPRLSGQHADYIEKQLRDFRAGARVNDGDQRTMRSVAKNLSDAEIKALANFISGLN
ncbi:cytochrome c [Pseudomaricurvus sp. HS19]|uniref:c-type cytochrome n=1 Tax=Pseudomaricurvus sp. HS19 TaxID=2692626 RepID=UPI0013702F74|nr:c-type cytochrome [Pseudomaricurvus sp. HS19]MYM63728.1 c-type cytochrome [Pseudomaricurvus sp. HS19]